MTTTLNLKELAEFLVRAKRSTYAGNGREVAPESVQRPGFKELEYNEGIWNYRDSYAGFFMAPGQEVVRVNNQPVWAMAYSGGMRRDLIGDISFAKETFKFLKEMLGRVEVDYPFRGPHIVMPRIDAEFKGKDWKYTDGFLGGDIRDFRGREGIYYRDVSAFSQDYVGGLIMGKEGLILS